MNGTPVETRISTLSVKVYQALLAAYPTKFQREYGPHMVQVFRDCCLRTFHKNGTWGMVRLWASTILDFLHSVLEQHLKQEVSMKTQGKPEDTAMAGLALIAGGVAFLLGTSSMTTSEHGLWGMAFVLIMFLSMPLLVVGLLGLRTRYGERAGWFGKNILLVGAILGPLTSLTIFLSKFFPSPNWMVGFSGHAVLFACLALFGFVALVKKPLPRWNAVPILAGIWYPAMFVHYSLARTTVPWEGSGGIPMAVNAAILFGIQGLAVAALGYILTTDLPKATTALAGPNA